MHNTFVVYCTCISAIFLHVMLMKNRKKISESRDSTPAEENYKYENNYCSNKLHCKLVLKNNKQEL